MLHRTNRPNLTFMVSLAGISLLLGILIYLLYRPAEPMAVSLLRDMGLGGFLDAAREKSLSSGSLIPPWMRYSLPNGLWAFSYALLITMMWGDKSQRIRYVWLATIPILVLGSELLQLTGILRGTFSGGDVAAAITGAAGGFLTGSFYPSRKPKSKSKYL